MYLFECFRSHSNLSEATVSSLLNCTYAGAIAGIPSKHQVWVYNKPCHTKTSITSITSHNNTPNLPLLLLVSSQRHPTSPSTSTPHLQHRRRHIHRLLRVILLLLRRVHALRRRESHSIPRCICPGRRTHRKPLTLRIYRRHKARQHSSRRRSRPRRRSRMCRRAHRLRRINAI